jgi:hypothetical protein
LTCNWLQTAALGEVSRCAETQLTAIGEKIVASLQSTADSIAKAGEKVGGKRISPWASDSDVRRNLQTSFQTNVKAEPEGVKNARNELRTGAGEIGRVKVTPTFGTEFDGLVIWCRIAHYMETLMNDAPSRLDARFIIFRKFFCVDDADAIVLAKHLLDRYSVELGVRIDDKARAGQIDLPVAQGNSPVHDQQQ